jgi:pilin isopeptide linkage protein
MLLSMAFSFMPSVAFADEGKFKVSYTSNIGLEQTDEPDIAEAYERTSENIWGEGKAVPEGYSFKEFEIVKDDNKQLGEVGTKLANITIPANACVSGEEFEIKAIYVFESDSKAAIQFTLPEEAEGTMAPFVFNPKEDTTLPKCTATVEGKVFDCWETGEGDSLKTFADEAAIEKDTFGVGNTYEFRGLFKSPNEQTRNILPVTVTFSFPEGASGTMDNYTFVAAQGGELPACTVTVEGKEFKHWKVVDSDPEVTYADGAAIPADTYAAGTTVALLGVYEGTQTTVEPVTVTFGFPEGASGTMDDYTFAAAEGGQLPACTVTVDGLEFKHWKVAGSDPEVTYADGAAIPADTYAAGTTVSLLGIYENPAAALVMVVFNFPEGASGTMDPYMFAASEGGQLPACSVTLDGGTFSKWKDVENAGTYFDDGAAIAAGAYQPGDVVTLLAIYEMDPVTITFAAPRGSTGTMDDDTFAADEDYVIPACGFTVENGTFDHWEDADGAEYDDGGTIPAGTYAAGDTVTLIPVFTFEASVSFVGPTGAAGTMDPEIFDPSQDYQIPACGYSVGGKFFDHWVDADDSTKTYNDEDTIPAGTYDPQAMVRLTAVFGDPVTVEFTFPDGASGTMDDYQFNAKEGGQLPACTVTFPNGTFAAWSIVGGLTGVFYDDEATIAPDVYQAGDTVTLLANYDMDPVTVNFTFPTGASGTMDSLEFPADEDKDIPACTVTVTDKTFDHWVDADDDTKTFADGDTIDANTYNPGDVVTLEAVYIDNAQYPATLVFAFPSDVSGSMENVTFNAEADKTIPACTVTKSGASFLHWEVVNSNPTKTYDDCAVIPADTYAPGDTITLLAVYEDDAPTNTATLRFVFPTGAVGSMDDVEFEVDTPTTIPQCTVTKANATFDHWVDNDDTSRAYIDKGTIAANTYVAGQVVVLRGLFKENAPDTYTVKFISNIVASGSMPDKTVKCNESFVIPVNQFTANGYVFDHWEVVNSNPVKTYAQQGVIYQNTYGKGDIVVLKAILLANGSSGGGTSGGGTSGGGTSGGGTSGGGSTTNPTTYRAVSDDLPVQKYVNGAPTTPGNFRFTLKAKNAQYPMPTGSDYGEKSVFINGATKVNFGLLTFSKPGTYEYTVYEVYTAEPGYTYDSSTWTVRYDVTSNQNGILSFKRTIYKNGQQADNQNVILFTNVYGNGQGGGYNPYSNGKTGDNSNLNIYLVLLAVSTVAIASGGYIYSKKKRENGESNS